MVGDGDDFAGFVGGRECGITLVMGCLGGEEEEEEKGRW